MMTLKLMNRRSFGPCQKLQPVCTFVHVHDAASIRGLEFARWSWGKEKYCNLARRRFIINAKDELSCRKKGEMIELISYNAIFGRAI